MPDGRKPYLTTREVSAICDVSIVTAGNWIRSGKLKAHRPPGGRYRIHPEDLFSFLAAGGMPIPDDLKDARRPAGASVLVVDDEPSFARFVSRLLDSHAGNCRVLEASNGFEAGRRLAEHRPDLVILDLRMPGLDGFAVCRELKNSSRYSDVKVLIVSGFLDDEARKRAEAAGADHCLPKPVRPEDLLAAVSKLLPRLNVAEWAGG